MRAPRPRWRSRPASRSRRGGARRRRAGAVRALRPASLAGLALAVVASFAIGVVAGLVSGDPAPLWDYAAGRTEPLAWPAAEAEPSAAEPAGRPSAQPTAAAAAAGRGVARERPATEAARRGGWAVQVGAFVREQDARALGQRLAAAGYSVSLPRAGEAAGNRFRVWVGPVASAERARELAHELHGRHGFPTRILEVAAGGGPGRRVAP